MKKTILILSLLSATYTLKAKGETSDTTKVETPVKQTPEQSVYYMIAPEGFWQLLLADIGKCPDDIKGVYSANELRKVIQDNLRKVQADTTKASKNN